MRLVGMLLMVVMLSGCSTLDGLFGDDDDWYDGPYRQQAKNDFHNMSVCTGLKKVDHHKIELKEIVIREPYPHSFSAPDGTRVHGYNQKLGNHKYKIVSIDDPRVLHHERGHTHMWENGINSGHPREFRQCYFLWRTKVWNALVPKRFERGPQVPRDSIKIIDAIFDEHGNRIPHEGESFTD